MTTTTIRILKSGDEPAMEDFLRPQMAESMFLLSNMRSAGLVDRGGEGHGTYAAAFDGPRIVAVAAHYWLNNIIPQAPPELPPAVVRAAIDASSRPVIGAVGPAKQVQQIIELLDLPVGTDAVQMDEHEHLLALELNELAVPDALASGRVCARRIEPPDVEQVIDWLVNMQMELMNQPDEQALRARKRRQVAQSSDLGKSWVLEADGQLVACSAFNATLAEAVQIGGVYTPPPLRRRGYGRCVVAQSLIDAQTDGVQRAILFTGKKNAAAITAYTALGFHPIGDFRVFLLHEPM